MLEVIDKWYWAVYSIAERDRRWREVRQRAAAAGFDCVFVPLGNGADGRYLTQFKAASIILPSDGRAPIVMVEQLTERGAFNDWVPEPRIVRRGQWPTMLSAAFVDLGMERARIGVVGVRGGRFTHAHNPDGSIGHSVFAELVGQLPHASFEDATDLVGSCRYVKSDEELIWIRGSSSTADEGVDALVGATRPGMTLGMLHAEVIERMLEVGGEYRPCTFSIDGGSIDASAWASRAISIGLVIGAELNVVSGHQCTQRVQQVMFGQVAPRTKALSDLHREVFDLGFELMRPGLRMQELSEAVARLALPSEVEATAAILGCGYGDDGPILGRGIDAGRFRDVELEAGAVVVWRPRVAAIDGEASVEAGGPVLITANGPELLFDRKEAIISIG